MACPEHHKKHDLIRQNDSADLWMELISIPNRARFTRWSGSLLSTHTDYSNVIWQTKLMSYGGYLYDP